MDVGGVFLDGLRQHGIQQPDDGRVIFAFEQVGRLGQLFGEQRQVGVAFEAFRGFHRCFGAGFVGLLQHLVESVGRNAFQTQTPAQMATDLGDAARVGAFAASD